ncbi:MAG: 2-hydroxyacid dehydrogenase [Candidatus Omnitrophota bacterium]
MNMKPKVILTQRYQSEPIEQLQTQYNLIMVEGSGKTILRVVEENPDALALISFLSEKIGKDIIDAGKNLKIIANYAVGYNNIDVAHAISKGIYVTNTPDILTDATADLTMALILAVARRIVEGDAFMRRGEFTGWGANLMLGKALQGAKLGIIGMGRIGLATARRAMGFGMDILYYSRSRKKDLEEQYGFKYTEFLDLIRQSDVISPHFPSSPETRHLFNKDVFDLMKKDAIFINAARGDLIDEAYLAEKLEKNELFGAGFDVYEFEPRVTEKLIGLKNVVLAPHVGSATFTARLGMAYMTIEDVGLALSGSTPKRLVAEWKRHLNI